MDEQLLTEKLARANKHIAALLKICKDSGVSVDSVMLLEAGREVPCSAILANLESEAEAAWKSEDARVQQVSPELRLDVAAHAQYLRGIADGIRKSEQAIRSYQPNDQVEARRGGPPNPSDG